MRYFQLLALPFDKDLFKKAFVHIYAPEDSDYERNLTDSLTLLTTFLGLPNRELFEKKQNLRNLLKNFMGWQEKVPGWQLILLAIINIPIHTLLLPFNLMLNLSKLLTEYLPLSSLLLINLLKKKTEESLAKVALEQLTDFARNMKLLFWKLFSLAPKTIYYLCEDFYLTGNMLTSPWRTLQLVDDFFDYEINVQIEEKRQEMVQAREAQKQTLAQQITALEQEKNSSSHVWKKRFTRIFLVLLLASIYTLIAPYLAKLLLKEVLPFLGKNLPHFIVAGVNYISHILQPAFETLGKTALVIAKIFSYFDVTSLSQTYLLSSMPAASGIGFSLSLLINVAGPSMVNAFQNFTRCFNADKKNKESTVQGITPIRQNMRNIYAQGRKNNKNSTSTNKAPRKLFDEGSTPLTNHSLFPKEQVVETVKSTYCYIL